MAIHQKKGKSDEWYTPKYIFEALEIDYFDLDVAHPKSKTFVPTLNFYTENSLDKDWFGLVWMNPPWCDTKIKIDWINKFIKHSNGLALMPDSTSSEWWQHFANSSEAILFTSKRICFIKDDGSKGSQPANGTTLFAIGKKAVKLLENAEKNKLGILFKKNI